MVAVEDGDRAKDNSMIEIEALEGLHRSSRNVGKFKQRVRKMQAIPESGKSRSDLAI